MTFIVLINVEKQPAFFAADAYLEKKYSTDTIEEQHKEWQHEFNTNVAWVTDYNVELTFSSETDYIVWLLRWG